MTKEMEKEIDRLYEFLKITKTDENQNIRDDKVDNERTNDYFERRWDSSFFATSMRY